MVKKVTVTPKPPGKYKPVKAAPVTDTPLMLKTKQFSDGSAEVLVPPGKYEVGKMVVIEGIVFLISNVGIDPKGMVLTLKPIKLHFTDAHDPFETIGIKKEWAKSLKKGAEQQGTTHADIEFMEDMFADTPVDPHALSYVTVKEAVVGEDPPPNPANILSEKVKADYVPGMSLSDAGPYPDIPVDPTKPIIMGVDTASDVDAAIAKIKSMPLVVEEEVSPDVAQPVSIDLPPHITIKVKITKLVLTENAMNKLESFVQGLTGFSSGAVKVALAGSLWMPLKQKHLEKFATTFSEFENYGVEFSIKES
jgi:hypothetical protein